MHTATLCPVPLKENIKLTAADFVYGDIAVITAVRDHADLGYEVDKPVIFFSSRASEGLGVMYLYKKLAWDRAEHYYFRRLRKGEQIIIEGQ